MQEVVGLTTMGRGPQLASVHVHRMAECILRKSKFLSNSDPEPVYFAFAKMQSGNRRYLHGLGVKDKLHVQYPSGAT